MKDVAKAGAQIESGWAVPEMDQSAGYTVHAAREPSSATACEWSTVSQQLSMST